MPVRALEFFCGIGGLHLALSRSNVGGTVVQAFDWDQAACEVYSANYSQNIIKKVDISTLTAAELASYNCNMWLLSPPCQPYTLLNPTAKGPSDPRAIPFLYLIKEILPALAATQCLPQHIFIENVAGFQTSSSRLELRSTLQSLGYTLLELLLTPLQYGVPNSRLRYYLLAKLWPQSFSNVPPDTDKVWRQIPGETAWTDPRTSDDRTDISPVINSHLVLEYLDDESQQQSHQYKISDKVMKKRGTLFDIVLPSSSRTCCFTRGYTQLVEGAGSVLQTNVTLDTSLTFEYFLSAQTALDEQCLDILRPLGLRYFSPSELLRIFDFTPPGTNSHFHWPKSTSTKTKFRLIGNSVNVKVVEHLINYLLS